MNTLVFRVFFLVIVTLSTTTAAEKKVKAFVSTNAAINLLHTNIDQISNTNLRHSLHTLLTCSAESTRNIAGDEFAERKEAWAIYRAHQQVAACFAETEKSAEGTRTVALAVYEYAIRRLQKFKSQPSEGDVSKILGFVSKERDKIRSSMKSP